MRICAHRDRYSHLRLSIALALLLAACGERAPHLQRLDQDAVVLAFGDSLTYGTGASTQESYPAQIERLIGRRVINAGVPGEHSEQGAARLPALLDQYQSSYPIRLLILCHGGNDILQRGDLTQAAEHLRGMIRAARERGIDAVLVAVPKPGLWLSSAPLYAEIAHELGVPVEKKALSSILGDRNLKSDTVHPNAAGYRKLAEAIAHLLRQSGAIE
jgi:acyl-CoA thioesterase-1